MIFEGRGIRSPNHCDMRPTYLSRFLFLQFVFGVLILLPAFSGSPARAATNGIIIYSEHGISDPQVLEFEQITWKSGYGGTVTRPNGREAEFVNGDAKVILYFDPAFYKVIDANSVFEPMRANVKARELVIDRDPKTIIDAGDAKRVSSDIAALAGAQRSYPVCAPILEPILRSLRQEVEHYAKGGEQKRAGHWLTNAEAAAADAKAKAAFKQTPKSDALRFTFTTLDGKTFQGVSLSKIDPTGFTIIKDEGVVWISFDALREDISDLDPKLAARVQEVRDAAKERAKKEAEARKLAEEERLAKQKAEQDQAVPPKPVSATPAPAMVEGATPAPAVGDDASHSKPIQSEAAQAAEAERLKKTQEEEAARTLAQAKAAEEEKAQALAAAQAAEKLEASHFFRASNPVGAGVSALACLLVVLGYVAGIKRQWGWGGKIGACAALFILGLAAGVALDRFGGFGFGVDAPPWLGGAMGGIPALVGCALLEAGCRLWGKRNRAPESDPEMAATYFESALVKFNHRDFSGCIADCTKAICLNANSAEGYSLRGNAKTELGDQDEAIADYKMAIIIDPVCAVNYYNLANARHDLGEFARAIADYSKAIELAPENAHFFNNRGIALMSKGDLDLAIADFTLAIEANPLYAGAYANRATAHSQKGQEEAAEQDQKKAAELEAAASAPEQAPAGDAPLPQA